MKQFKLRLARIPMSVRKMFVLATCGVVAAVAAGAALATPPFLFTATPLARGSDVAIVKVVQGVGGHSGWHTHPGPAIVFVRSGQLTIQQAEDCSSTTYTAGQFVIEPAGDVHIARNTGATPLELWITFLNLPAGANNRIDAPDPGC